MPACQRVALHCHCSLSLTAVSPLPEESLCNSLLQLPQAKYIQKGDSIVALHRIGNASVIKIVDIK